MGGSVKFDYIIVFSKRRYIPVDKFRSQKRLVIDHISSISALDGGKLALSSEIYSRVQVIDLNGDLLEQYIYLREARGIFYYNGTIYVCDSDRIRLFSGGRTGMLGQFYLKEPYAIAVESGGYYVIDGNHVKIFNRFFRPVSTFTDPENIKNPTAIAVDGSSIYIADPVLGQVSIFSKVDNKFVGSIKDVFIKPYDVKVDSLGRLLVVDAGLGAIVRVVDSRVDKIYRAESIGGFKFPRAISLIDDRVFIADMDRIVVIDSSLSRIESIITSK
jgi:DNA-binding beta-propeller fold protein YncE